MQDFGKWLADFSLPAQAPAEDMLPEGVDEGPDGTYTAQCCGCERWTELPEGLDGIPMTGYRHYCGGAPWCCP